jgi:hypothetical protein
MCERCCAKQCLVFAHSYDKEVVKDCIEELINLRKRMSQNEKRTYLMGLVRAVVTRVSDHGRFTMEWRINSVDNKVKISCCKEAFAKVYGTSSSTLDNLVKGIKGCTNNFDAILCDRTKVQGSASEVADLVNFCKSIGVTLKQKQLSTVLLPNTPVSLCCYCWMERYFDAMGDYQPNR